MAKTVKPKTKAVKTEETYSFVVKGNRRKPNQIINIGGQDKAFDNGAKITCKINDLKVPPSIKKAFGLILTKADLSKLNVELGIKSGYNSTQFGLTKPGQAWRGFVTYTDSQFCIHTWDKRSIDKSVILSTIKSNEASVNRQGKNWVTVSFSKNDSVKLSKIGQDLLSKLK